MRDYSELDLAAIIVKAKSASAVRPFMTVKEAAKILGASVRTIRRWEAAGQMPQRRKWGRQKVYNAEDIRALEKARRGE